MKVRLQGFSFYTGKNISQGDFVNRLIECDEGDFEFSARKRFFFFSDKIDDAYFVGLLITIKDHKKFCELQNKNGKRKILVSQAGAGNDLMEFNFFVINKVTYAGLYQYYHQSCSLNQFGYFLSTLYRDLKEEKILSEVKKSGATGQAVEKVTKKTKSKYAGYFRFSVMYKKESLEKLTAELESIKSFDYDVYNLDAKEAEFTPAPQHAIKVHKRVLFNRKATVSGVLKGIKKFIADTDLGEGTIRGYDPEGLEKIIKLTDNPDYFGEYDFDEVASELQDHELDELKSNWIVDELLKVAKENPHLFETPADEEDDAAAA